MNTKHSILLTAGLLLLAGAALAPSAGAHGGAEHLTVTAHDDGGDYWFTVEGYDGQNPALILSPDTTYEVTLIGADDTAASHNLVFGWEDTQGNDRYVNAGENTTFQVTTPAEGDYPFTGGEGYWCTPHKSAGMAGAVFASEEQKNNGGDNGENGAPGFGAVAAIGAVGAALVALSLTRRD